MNKYDKILKIYEHGILEKSCPEGQQWCPVRKECVPMGQGKGKMAEGDEKSSKEYQAFFKKMLKKFGVTEPDKLPDDKKKEFYDAVDKGWKGKDEKPEKGEKTDEATMDRQDKLYKVELTFRSTIPGESKIATELSKLLGHGKGFDVQSIKFKK